MQKKQKTQKKVAMPDSQPPLTRDRILDAAQTILLRDGGDRLTIASVAKEARISKGGLFYHFASKQELVEGLIERYTREFDPLLESAGDSPGSAIDTYIRSAGRSDGPASRGVIAMLAAVIVDSEALGLLRQKYDHWNERLHADGIPPHIVSTVRYAVDGLWLADTLQLAAPSRSSRDRTIEFLQQMVKPFKAGQNT